MVGPMMGDPGSGGLGPMRTPLCSSFAFPSFSLPMVAVHEDTLSRMLSSSLLLTPEANCVCVCVCACVCVSVKVGWYQDLGTYLHKSIITRYMYTSV